MRNALLWLCLSALACLPVARSTFAADMPPLDLIDSNVRDTAYTAHVRIDSVEAKDSTHASGGYVTFHVHATVLETFRGETRPQVDYFETHDAPSKGPQAGSDIVVSLDKLDDGNYAVPDNGYVFPATRTVLERARRAAKAIIRRPRQH